MNQLRLFRVLIWAQMGLTLLGILATLRLERTLPSPLRDYLHARQNDPVRTLDVAVAAGGLILLAAFVTSWVALLRFWRIGPWLYLVTTGASIALVLGAGPTVATAIETTISALVSTLGGAVLAMAFCSELRVRFGLGGPSP
jgi:hypothetical protein